MLFTFPFVIVLSGFFLLLWLADLYFTLKSTEKKGHGLEANPLMRALLQARRAHLYLFKALEILCFFVLIYFISNQNADYPVIILLLAIAVYAFVVSNGMAIYLQITKKHAVVARLSPVLPVTRRTAPYSSNCTFFIFRVSISPIRQPVS